MSVEMDVCDNCEHSKLCKFREAYKELGHQAAANLDVSPPFKVVIVCPYFSRGTGFNSSGVVYRDGRGNNAVHKNNGFPSLNIEEDEKGAPFNA